MRQITLKLRPEECEQVAIANFIRKNYPNIKFSMPPITQLTFFQGIKCKQMGYSRGFP